MNDPVYISRRVDGCNRRYTLENRDAADGPVLAQWLDGWVRTSKSGRNLDLCLDLRGAGHRRGKDAHALSPPCPGLRTLSSSTHGATPLPEYREHILRYLTSLLILLGGRSVFRTALELDTAPCPQQCQYSIPTSEPAGSRRPPVAHAQGRSNRHITYLADTPC